MISDREREEIIDYIDTLMAHLQGFSYGERGRRARTLLNSKLKDMQSGLNQNVCPMCLGTGKARE